MTYRIDIYAAPRRLTGVRLVDAPDGPHALAAARDDLARTGGYYAEVFQADGTGGDFLYYALVAAR